MKTIDKLTIYAVLGVFEKETENVLKESYDVSDEYRAGAEFAFKMLKTAIANGVFEETFDNVRTNLIVK